VIEHLDAANIELRNLVMELEQRIKALQEENNKFCNLMMRGEELRAQYVRAYAEHVGEIQKLNASRLDETKRCVNIALSVWTGYYLDFRARLAKELPEAFKGVIS